MSLPEYLTPEEAAKTLRVSARTILRAVQRGDLAAVRFGQTVRIPAEALSPAHIAKGESK